jgi:hypothetical protein
MTKEPDLTGHGQKPPNSLHPVINISKKLFNGKLAGEQFVSFDVISWFTEVKCWCPGCRSDTP